MSNTRLEMTFQNEAGRRVTVSVQDPRPDLIAADVETAMAAIVANNVFDSNGGDLTGILGARIVSREVEELF